MTEAGRLPVALITHQVLHPVAVRRYEAGQAHARVDTLAVEAPIALVFNGISHAVMMATPQDLEDLGLGFALSEGLIASPAECLDVQLHTHPQGLEVHLHIAQRAFAQLKQRRRSLEGRTGCGLCGLESLEQLDWHHLPHRQTPAHQAGPLSLSPDVILRAFSALPKQQQLNAQTGACHAAAWVTPDGDLMHVREDVGRHNALDKLLGHRALAPQSNQSGFVIISSRASVELVLKCARLGVTALAAISAPTSLAVEIAQQTGLQLYGFCRGEQVVHYTPMEALI
jgi:FdhD protein